MSGALPDLDFEPTRGFWSAAARGELAIPQCASCSRYVWYPREACPHCDAGEMPWKAVSGRGTLFSWARVDRALFKPFASKTPYVTGLVALEEDPCVRVVSLIVGCDPDRLVIDMPLEVVFRELAFPDEDGVVQAPFFQPLSEPSQPSSRLQESPS